MKLSLAWLQEFLPLAPTAEEVANALTSAGLEVSELRYLGEGFEKVVVAKIVEAAKHPNADRLTVCRVDDGSGTHEIVCGASNFKTGDHVALAHVGANLPNGMAIRASKIRGVASAGMLCSREELGLAETSEGILILPEEIPLGTPLARALGRADWVLTLELTPNRGDCLSVTGIAREVATALSVSPKVPAGDAEGPADSTLRPAVKDREGAPRYVLRLLESLQVGASPPWMKDRLEACGVRSISNVVDVTNYVMLERGQPLHAFDRDQVVGEIQIRRAIEGERITCLDGVERTLLPSDLVIADDHGPVAIAGVMGGARTAVSAGTKAILLESAHFDPRSVRGTAKRLSLHTESSHRFERWVDPGGVWSASDRAVELLSKVAGGKGTVGIDCRAQKVSPLKLRLRSSEIRRILGVEIKNAGEILSRLGLSVEKADQDWIAEIPSRRPDLSREIDLIEEVARVHGYGRILSALAPIHAAPAGNREYERTEQVRDLCRSAGFSEVRGYSFSDEKEIAEFPAESLGQPLTVRNPIVSEMTRMRQSLIPALIRTWRTNQFRQSTGGRFFEVGKVFGTSSPSDSTPAREETHLGMLWGGESFPRSWRGKGREATFHDARGVVDFLTDALGLRAVSPSGGNPPCYLHPGKSARLLWRDREIGAMGTLHPGIARESEVRDVIVAELNLSALLPAMSETNRFKSYSSFPTVSRDLALVVPSEVAWGRIEEEVSKVKDPLLQRTELFDVYEGKGVPAGSKSLAFSLLFGAERTLTDPEIEASVKKILTRLEASLGAVLRS